MYLQGTAAPTRYSHPTRYSRTYEVQPHLLDIAAPMRDTYKAYKYSYKHEVKMPAPTRYSSTNEVQLHLQGTAASTSTTAHTRYI